MKTLGALLVILGIGLTVFTGAKFFTREKVVDLGKVKIMRNKPNYMSWSPLLGIVVLGIGGVILWQAQKSNS